MRPTRARTTTAVMAAALTAACLLGAAPAGAASAQTGPAKSGPAKSASAKTASAKTGEPLEYVAIGDSFAAGPLIPDQNQLSCLRSARNYPAVAAEALGARLTDVSCSGAKVSDFAGRQFGLLAPQYEALKPSTDLVTVTIGGNDVSLVATALGCVNLLPKPTGISCADTAASKGDPTAKAIDAWSATFGKALDEVHRRAPNAKIVVAGYATYIREDGCWPTQPIWDKDGNYLQARVNQLNGVLAAQSRAHHATYVDTAAVSAGHDTCAAPSERYIEGLVPTSVAAPLHPNARGMEAFGKAVAGAARG
ncbi:SGNH/GDSL hydrolase family protein [Streptomyces sp. NPDC046853]|uniref:SGNH/GDSL hydrolase family protein n=1 Tax=Streptomyces sp. NPDC046853 TaxID=3154920 RepID=UPI003405BAEB